MCVSGIQAGSFYDFSIGFWNFGIFDVFVFTLLYIIKYNPTIIRLEMVTWNMFVLPSAEFEPISLYPCSESAVYKCSNGMV
jgi:hypothetical protein